MHISLPALQASGGLLLLLVAMELLTGRMDEPPAAVRRGQRRAGAARHAAAGRAGRDRRDDGVRAAADGRGPTVGRSRSGVVAVHLVPLGCDAVRHRHPPGAQGQRHHSLVTRIAGLLLSAIAVQLIADAVRAFVAQGSRAPVA